MSGISMDHNDIRHRLSEYIDGSVTGEERAAIDAHLKTCLQCSSALEELRKTIEHIKTIEEIDPPAWMTQKIMATIRAEAAEKKGFFHRFFFPLRIKLPIQAIAVLFLAVTGFYIYQNIQRGERVSEAPIQEFAAKKPAPPTGTAQDKLAKADIPSRSKSVQQTPAYKALDMKQEYETPPPPAPAEKTAGPPASSPAEHPALAGNEAASEKRSAEPQASAPKKKLRAALADGGADSAIKITAINITVSVKDIESAARDTEATIKRLGGTITKTEQFALKRIYTTTLSANRVDDLLIKLNLIGDVKDKAATPESSEDRMELKIELVKASTP